MSANLLMKPAASSVGHDVPAINETIARIFGVSHGADDIWMHVDQTVIHVKINSRSTWHGMLKVVM